MKNLRDIEKTLINSYGQSDYSNFKSLPSKDLYEYIHKKTEKIVTAIYMVTDYMEDSEALKSKLRFVSVELLSLIFTLATVPPVDKSAHISVSLVHVHELISFIEIANTIGFISDMNTNILKREFIALIKDIEEHQVKDKHFTFSLDKEMFAVESPFDKGQMIKDKRTDGYFSPPNGPVGDLARSGLSEGRGGESKESRVTKILAFLKDKHEVSIKDISASIPDCSEKTIQRELNSLVFLGQIKKTGAKRWSRYQLA
jgi:hypothetical protein